MTGERLYSAREVAECLGWVVGTVYVNRRLSIARVQGGQGLRPTDMPTGTRMISGLRWTETELRDYAAAKNSSTGGGGRPRRSPPVLPPPRTFKPTAPAVRPAPILLELEGDNDSGNGRSDVGRGA